MGTARDDRDFWDRGRMVERAVASFETSDGHTLSYESWRDPQAAADTPPITVVFLHGVHESADTLVCAVCVGAAKLLSANGKEA